jgi:molecular chaperone DnaK
MAPTMAIQPPAYAPLEDVPAREPAYVPLEDLETPAYVPLELEASPPREAPGFDARSRQAAPFEPPSRAAPYAAPSPGPSPFTPPAAAPSPVRAAPRASPVVLDVTPRGLGIGTVAGFCEELIRRNSRLPTEMRKMFVTSRDDQDAVRIIVVQGESRRMQQNTVIADLRLDNLPRRPRGETSIEVTFALDANGILNVHARDAKTGREQRATLDIIGSIPQEDVSASRERLQALRR